MPDELWARAGLFGVLAGTAAFAECTPWLDRVVEALDENRRLLAELLADRLPDVGYHLPEATYLAWLDFETHRVRRRPGRRVVGARQRGTQTVGCPLGWKEPGTPASTSQHLRRSSPRRWNGWRQLRCDGSRRPEHGEGARFTVNRAPSPSIDYFRLISERRTYRRMPPWR